jgi:hypothetical protein
VTITLCDESFVEKSGYPEEQDARVDDNGGGGEYGEICDVPTGGDVGIRLLILSGEVFDSKSLRFRAKLKGCQRVGGMFVGWEDFVNCRAVRRVWLEVRNRRSRLAKMTR